MKNMKYIKLFEDYINSPSNRIQTLLKNIVTMLKATFEGTNGVFSKEEISTISLVELEQSNSNDSTEKNVILSFSDTDYLYQIILIVKIEDIKENNPIENAYMKIKLYNQNAEMLEEWQSNLKIQEATSDEITKEGRFFIKVQPVEKTEDSSGDNMDFLEHFIIAKISELKSRQKKKPEGEEKKEENDNN